MCSKFQILDDLQTVGGVWDTTFQQQTNHPELTEDITA